MNQPYKDIAGGKKTEPPYQEFQLLWTYQTNDPKSDGKSATFKATISWLDGNSKIKYTKSAKEITVKFLRGLIVKEIIAINLSTKQITYGQPFIVEMIIGNTGKINILDVKPSLQVLPKNENIILEKIEPEKANIDSGMTKTYLLYYKTQKGSEAEYTFIGSATGTNSISNSPIVAPDYSPPDINDIKFELLIQQPPKLVVEKIEFKTPIGQRQESINTCTGQTFDAFVTVTNEGDAKLTAKATDVQIDFKPSVNDIVDIITQPLVQEISVGEHKEFRFQYKGKAKATLTFTAIASGTDSNSKNPIEPSEPKISGEVKIQEVATLVVESIQFKKKGSAKDWSGTLAISEEQSFDISEGQSFNVRVILRNAIESGAEDISVELTPNIPNRVELADKPKELLKSLPSGETSKDYFIFEYSTQKGQSASELTFRATPSGKDSSCREDIRPSTTDSQVLAIQKPPVFEPKIEILDENHKPISQISAGQKIIVQLSVTNNGQATASQVQAKLTIDINGNKVELPVPDLPAEGSVDIDGGMSAIFEWNYQTSSEDANKTAIFSIVVNGVDANYEQSADPAAQITAQAEIKLPLVPRAVLVIRSIKLDLSVISQGQEIVVTMAVGNDGGDNAKGVVPSLTTDPEGAAPDPDKSKPYPTRADINKNGNQNYE